MRYRLMHISDLHAGPPFNPRIAELVAQQAHDMQPDLLVISGDLVQRADFARQWRAITAYLATLPQPQLIVPGNHDVPLFNPVNRLFFSLSRYRRYISTNINPVFELPGLAVVGGNTAHGLTVDGGYLSREQQAAFEHIFAGFDQDTCKVAVMHHPPLETPGDRRNRAITNANAAIQMLDRCDVELVLCGHVHISYIGNTLDVRNDLRRGTIVCQSGTTTSRRGHGRERGLNSFNVIEIDRRTIRILQNLYQPNVGRFVPVAEHVYPRRTSGVDELPAAERVLEP